MNERQAIQTLRAYHESGHAVIAYLCQALSRAPGYFVTIEQDGEFGGATPVNPAADLHTMFRILFAGYHAESEYCDVYGWETDLLVEEHAQHDFVQIQVRIHQATDQLEAARFVAQEAGWTVRQVRQPETWYAIRKLAHELYRHTRVEVREASGIIERALRDYQQRH